MSFHRLHGISCGRAARQRLRRIHRVAQQSGQKPGQHQHYPPLRGRVRGTLLYLANGDTSVGKEYCEAHAGGQSAIMDNFRELFLHRDGSVKRKKYDGLKGHKEEVVHFLNVVSGKESPSLSFDSIHATTLATLKAMDSLGHGKSLAI